MAQAEKLNLWDRFFNRYKTEIEWQGFRRFVNMYGYFDTGLLANSKIPNSEHDRYVIRYKKIDRLTGSETIFEKVL